MSTSLASWSRPAERPVALLAALLAAAVFLTAWAVLHVGFYDRDQIVDTGVYQRYGDAIADGELPYRDFRPEYPPAALPVFAVPSLLADTGDADGYRRAFELLMAACGVAALGAMAFALVSLEAAPPRLAGALGFFALAPLALGSVMLSRFDLWPAALTAVALAAVLDGRDRLGAAALGVAVAAKVYPLVLVPLVGCWLWRRSGRRGAQSAGMAFGLAAAVCVVPFAVLALGGLWDALSRQISRPLQIESLGAALVALAHHVGGVGVIVVTSHGSQNVGGGLGDAVGGASTLVQVAVLAALWVVFAQGPMERERLVRYSAAALVAFVALGKVLSPQFLIWLLPLVPLVRGRRGVTASALLASALVVTQLWFPYRYWELANELDPNVVSLVLLRDGLLVALLLVLVRPERSVVERWVDNVGVTWDGLPVSREKPHGAAVLVWRRGADGGREWLVLHRAGEGPDHEGDWAWTPPAGARLPGEPIDACARRELAEETGLALEPVDTHSGTAEWAVYVAEAPRDAAVALDDEHDRYEWVPLAEASRRCLPTRVGQDFVRASRAVDRA